MRRISVFVIAAVPLCLGMPGCKGEAARHERKQALIASAAPFSLPVGNGNYIEDLDGIVVGSATRQQRLNNSRTINRLLARGAVLRMKAGTRVEIARSLRIGSGGGIIGSRSGAKPVIFMPASEFMNADNSPGNRYGPTAVGVNFSGGHSPSAATSGVRLENLAIISEQGHGRYLRGIAGVNVRGCQIRNVEISGVPTGVGIALSSARGCSISDVYIHDFADATAWLTLPQLTGIEIDNDLVGGIASEHIKISNFRIENLTVAGPMLARWGYQTDGINIANNRARVAISSGRIANVGEGIDTFGSGGSISEVTIDSPYVFGLKFVHGASNNSVDNVVIVGAGLAGVTFAGSQSAHQHTQGNVLRNIRIVGIDPRSAWRENATAGVLIVDNRGTAALPQGNWLENVTIELGPHGKYGWLDTSHGWSNGGCSIRINGGRALQKTVEHTRRPGSVAMLTRPCR